MINNCDSLNDYFNCDVCVLIDKNSIDNNHDLLVKETYEYKMELYEEGEMFKDISLYYDLNELLYKNNKNIQIKANKSSLRYMNVKTIFETSYNYQRQHDSHMMKNTEWGAIAYLSHSKYGINKEVNINIITSFFYYKIIANYICNNYYSITH